MYSYGGIWHFVWDEERRGGGGGADSALPALTSIFLAPYYHPCQSHHHPHYNFRGGIYEHQKVIKRWPNAITSQLLVGRILLTWSITAKESKTCWKEEADMIKIEIRMGGKRQHDVETKLKNQAKQKGLPVGLGKAWKMFFFLQEKVPYRGGVGVAQVLSFNCLKKSHFLRLPEWKILFAYSINSYNL